MDEVIAIDAGEPRRGAILRLLSNWKISIEITGEAEVEQELIMVLSQAYLEWEQQTEQRGRQEGEQTGILKGRQEGKLEGEQALILHLLTRRIGSLAPEVRSQVQALSLAQLESLGEALLDFAEAGDLVKWLERHSQS